MNSPSRQVDNDSGRQVLGYHRQDVVPDHPPVRLVTDFRPLRIQVLVPNRPGYLSRSGPPLLPLATQAEHSESSWIIVRSIQEEDKIIYVCKENEVSEEEEHIPKEKIFDRVSRRVLEGYSCREYAIFEMNEELAELKEEGYAQAEHRANQAASKTRKKKPATARRARFVDEEEEEEVVQVAPGKQRLGGAASPAKQRLSEPSLSNLPSPARQRPRKPSLSQRSLSQPSLSQGAGATKRRLSQLFGDEDAPEGGRRPRSFQESMTDEQHALKGGDDDTTEEDQAGHKVVDDNMEDAMDPVSDEIIIPPLKSRRSDFARTVSPDVSPQRKRPHQNAAPPPPRQFAPILPPTRTLQQTTSMLPPVRASPGTSGPSSRISYPPARSLRGIASPDYRETSRGSTSRPLDDPGTTSRPGLSAGALNASTTPAPILPPARSTPKPRTSSSSQTPRPKTTSKATQSAKMAVAPSNIFTIGSILGESCVQTPTSRKKEFLVDWGGSHEATWQPFENVSASAIREFNEQVCGELGTPSASYSKNATQDSLEEDIRPATASKADGRVSAFDSTPSLNRSNSARNAAETAPFVGKFKGNLEGRSQRMGLPATTSNLESNKSTFNRTLKKVRTFTESQPMTALQAARAGVLSSERSPAGRTTTHSPSLRHDAVDRGRVNGKSLLSQEGEADVAESDEELSKVPRVLINGKGRSASPSWKTKPRNTGRDEDEDEEML